jgi:hypothetical protein
VSQLAVQGRYRGSSGESAGSTGAVQAAAGESAGSTGARQFQYRRG